LEIAKNLNKPRFLFLAQTKLVHSAGRVLLAPPVNKWFTHSTTAYQQEQLVAKCVVASQLFLTTPTYEHVHWACHNPREVETLGTENRIRPNL